MKVLDLFSGIGGFSLGLERAGMETVAFCEIEKFPQKVLKKHWPEVPIYDDIRKLTRERLTKDGIGSVDLVCGGFPCQPFSQAGKQEGFNDDRDLWPEMFRVIQEVRPRWVIGENVAGFVSMGLDRTLTDLEGAGYRTEQVIIPACAVGAPHRRDRIWIVAHASSGNINNPAIRETQLNNGGKVVADTIGRGQSGQGEYERSGNSKKDQNREADRAINCGQAGQGRRNIESRLGGMVDGVSHWLHEPDIPRVTTGIKDRTNRLKGLGNAVVPQIPEIIGRAIMEIEREKK